MILPPLRSWFCRAAVEPKGRNGGEGSWGGGTEEEEEEGGEEGEEVEFADAKVDVSACLSLSDSLARRVVATLFVLANPERRRATASLRPPPCEDGRIAGSRRREVFGFRWEKVDCVVKKIPSFKAAWLASQQRFSSKPAAAAAAAIAAGNLLKAAAARAKAL